MIIAPTCSFSVGTYTVWQRPRMDNPAFAQYLVFLGEKLIGKTFSVPDVDACRWLQQHPDGHYAKDSKPMKRWTIKAPRG